jgi:hypothetical protein
VTAPPTFALTAAEQREYDDLFKRGYRDITDAPRGIRAGVRVRHRGEQYLDAMQNGTGVIVAVMEKDPSPWVKSGWGPRDIELIVRTDEDRHGTGRLIGRWADYHTVVIQP